MEFYTDYSIEKYILDTAWSDLPEKVQRRAKDCAVDLFGALILGCHGKQYKNGVRIVQRLGLAGDIPVLNDPLKTNLLGASIIFGHGANSFDIDDGYNMVKGHPGSSFIGGVLAAALEKNCTYQDLLVTLVICYETAIRWGLAEQRHYGFLHSTGTYGAFGTAAGIGRLHGFTKEQMNNALSIADYHAPLTPVMRAVEYPSMNKDGVPFGALVGTMAVIETEAGETGRTHLLEVPEYREYIDSLGERYYINELYFKPYTCCRWAHQPIKACLDLISQYKLQYQDIRNVRINTFKAAASLSKKKPTDTDEAQYNIAYPVAAAIVHGDVGYDQIKDEALHNEEVLQMMDKLQFTVDDEMEKEFPDRRKAWVEIVMNDGRSYRSRVYEAPGEHTDPELSTDWIRRKFYRITKPVLTAQGQAELLDILSTESDLPVRNVIRIINQSLKDRS